MDGADVVTVDGRCWCGRCRQPTWNFNDKARLLDRLVQKPKDNDPRNNPSLIREFLVMLAVCHTVIPERDRVNKDRTKRPPRGPRRPGSVLTCRARTLTHLEACLL